MQVNFVSNKELKLTECMTIYVGANDHVQYNLLLIKATE